MSHPYKVVGKVTSFGGHGLLKTSEFLFDLLQGLSEHCGFPAVVLFEQGDVETYEVPEAVQDLIFLVNSKK